MYLCDRGGRILIAILLSALISLTPQELLDKVDSVSNIPKSIGTMEETIVTTSGKKRTFKIRYYTKDGTNKQLMVYLYPKPVEGTSFLLVGDNIWAYFPETDRIRKIASHAKRQKMMGSDFTYEDMSIENYKKKFEPEKMNGKKGHFILTILPKKGEDISYEKLILKIDKKNYVPTEIDFYRKGEKKPYKTLFQKNIRIVEGIPTPMDIVMVNNETGSKTLIKVLDIEYKVNLSNKLFSIENLKEVSE